MNTYYVYILASKTGVLYAGMTNNLERRVYEHKQHLIPGFTCKYNIDQLVYYSEFPTSLEAIESEKRIKKWSRIKKLNLIKELNPTFRDLSVNLEISRYARDDEKSTRDDEKSARDDREDVRGDNRSMLDGKRDNQEDVKKEIKI